MTWLINPAQLDKFRKSQKNIVILDASFHHDGRDAKKEFEEKHIIGARFFDIDLLSDPTSSLPHTFLLDEKILSEKISSLGIREDSKIIFYDNSDLHSACRAIWMFKMCGHHPKQLYLLDGGLAAWEEKGGKLESSSVGTVSAKPYKVHLKMHFLTTLSQMKNNVLNSIAQVIDLRHPVRYAGGPETRLGLRPGHIPGAFGFPFFGFYEKNGCFIGPDKMRKRLSDLGVNLKDPIISMCGSGVTACVLDILLDLIGHSAHTVYDGSWTEWGALALYPGEENLSERPIETCLE